MASPTPEHAGAAGLEGLPGLVLDTVISKAGARPAAVLACASTRLRAAVAEDALWRRFCADDFGLLAPLDPADRPLPFFKDAYKVWLKSFGMYPLPLVKRVKIFWSSLKSWLSENFPEALKTLSKGVSEAQIKSAEDDLGFKLPMPTKLLYRFCNGQLPLSENHYENVRMAPLGIIGGYLFSDLFYDHFVNVHLSPLEQIVEATREFYHAFNDQGVFNGSKLIIVASSWYYPKTFLLNCSNGELYVGTANLPKGEMMPCVPKSLIRPTNKDMPQDGLLLWLEERLLNGMIKTRMLKTLRYISLYPEAPPSCSSAMTNGVKVCASAVFVPEHPESGGPVGRYMYIYSIRLSVPEACRLGGVYYSSGQLYSRRWSTRWRGWTVSLLPGQEEFVYECCTGADNPESVEGSFTFVPRRVSWPEGKPFEATVAPFRLETPEYIY